MNEVLDSIRAEAAAVEQRLRLHLDTHPLPSARLNEGVRYVLLGGGKRLRPVLCLFTFDALQTERTPAVWASCLALEMMHTYSLVHDDLPAMDDDDLRRGRASCHVQFDEATAILVGDALQAEAFESVLSVDDADMARRLARWLSRGAGARGMVAGQQLDLDGARTSTELEAVHRLKTGMLFGAAMAMGAACAHVDEERVPQVFSAGERFGLAFQIIDDVLDRTASAAELGKTVGKDRAQGKVTAADSWGVDEARARARGESEAALEQLRQAGVRSPRLEQLAGFCLERSH